jgi:hypothetical protein
MAAHAGTREGLRSRVWTAVLAWALAKDNAKTDFAIIGVLNFAVGLALTLWPPVAQAPVLAHVMATLPRPVWAGWFLLSAVLVWAALSIADARPAGRLRHLAWISVGTAGVMWLVGLLFALPHGSLVYLLFAAALQCWYTLTLLRLELPLWADRARGSG